MPRILNSFIISAGICAAVLFWWWPAADLVSIQPMNWSAEYKNKIVSPKNYFGITGFAKRITSSDNPKPTLQEFIHQQTRDRLIISTSDALTSWLRQKLSDPLFDPDKPVFLNTTHPMLPDIHLPFGYIEISDHTQKAYLEFNRLEPDELSNKNIPTHLRFPHRTLALLILGLTLVWFFMAKFLPGSKNIIAHSTAATGTSVFMGIFTAGTTVMLLPFFYGWINDSPPFVFVGGFIVILGIIGLFMFGYQMIAAYALINGKQLIAHWTFDPEQWRIFTEKEYSTEKNEKRLMLVVISGIILLVGGIFWLIMRDKAAGIVFLVLLGVIAIIAFVAVIVPWLTYRRNLKQTGDIYIGKNCLYLNGAIHTWSFAGARLEDAKLVLKPSPLINITYTYWTSAGRNFYFYRQAATVRVPVPEGKREEARAVVNQLEEVIFASH
ncbi:MAG: hypothetical protein KKE62_10795 [Proteobacteria bacterium]|nr:hypothetical protein [Pseudomonadota bacterium]MBU1386704.1 hypothetical protein [Pseudomonadota bacterium]MBU1543315.1 hypothetical protein [Pseudomonadota bacterium]MBU2429662.1 hypothetical protein [Pseudomonadota bacterium]MBU2483146.1 hypothetical protein [Pseudomonadota bacterium]